MKIFRCLYRGMDDHIHHFDIAAYTQKSVRSVAATRPDVRHVIAVYPIRKLGVA